MHCIKIAQNGRVAPTFIVGRRVAFCGVPPCRALIYLVSMYLSSRSPVECYSVLLYALFILTNRLYDYGWYSLSPSLSESPA